VRRARVTLQPEPKRLAHKGKFIIATSGVGANRSPPQIRILDAAKRGSSIGPRTHHRATWGAN
jgi:hypothetical protein